MFYIANANHSNGSQRSCTSMGTNCLIEGLECGQNYSVSVTATNFKCNSSISAAVAITTGRWLGRGLFSVFISNPVISTLFLFSAY